MRVETQHRFERATLPTQRSPLLWLLLALVLLVLFGALAAHLTLHSAWGRERVRERINRAVSSGIQGELEVGEIEAIELPRIKAKNVKIRAPNGVPAIDVESADIEFDLSAFLSGDMRWRRADIRNGIVRVTEDARGRINMEETFKARAQPGSSGEKPRDDSELDMRTMVTSNMRLEIHGGSLPTLRLIDIYGIMRIEVAADGTTQIRFDEYRGHMVKGLPNGKLKFHDVKGHVQTGHQRLLRFDGKGLFEGERVAFMLDIVTEPETRVKIDADFPELSEDSLSTLAVGTWSKLNGSGIELKVHHGRTGKIDDGARDE